MLYRNHIALWDVIAQCDIVGSSDSSIKNVVPNDINKIIDASKITELYTNGKKAKALYDRYILPVTGKEAVCLPSTSPANATFSMEQLIESWKIILQE
jgi:hypoxanthine-DNA glycosylase